MQSFWQDQQMKDKNRMWPKKCYVRYYGGWEEGCVNHPGSCEEDTELRPEQNQGKFSRLWNYWWLLKVWGTGGGYPVCNRRLSSIPDLYPLDAKNMLPYPQHLWQPKMSLLLFSHPAVSGSLWPHGLQHARPPLHRSLLCRGEGACITQWSYKPCMSLGCRATEDKVFTAMVQMHALHTCWYPKFILNIISYVFKNRKITLSWTSKPMTTK